MKRLKKAGSAVLFFALYAFLSPPPTLQATAEARCLPAYEGHIRGMSHSELQRLKPSTYTREQIQEARERRSSTTLAGMGGMLVELNLLPLTILAAPWIAHGHFKIKRYKKMRDLLSLAYSEQNEGERVTSFFLKKIHRLYRRSERLRDLNRETMLNSEVLLSVVQFADQNLLLCPPFDHQYFQMVSANEDIFPHLLRPVTANQFIKKFPIIFEAYLYALNQHRRSAQELRSELTEMAKILGEITPEDEIDEGESCSICLEEFAATKEEAIIRFPCDQEGKTVKRYHTFHASCIKSALVRSDHCPLCRKKIRIASPH